MGRKAQISRDEVLRASLAIADRDGVEAVSMHSVARALGVTPMALYRHVGDKSALLDGLVESLLTAFELPAEELSWQERLRALGRSMRELARRHPSAFGLLLTRPAVTPAALRARHAAQRALRDAGLDEEQARRAERLTSSAVLGFAASEASGRFRQLSKRTIDADYEVLEDAIERALTAALAVSRAPARRARRVARKPAQPPRRSAPRP